VLLSPASFKQIVHGVTGANVMPAVNPAGIIVFLGDLGALSEAGGSTIFSVFTPRYWTRHSTPIECRVQDVLSFAFLRRLIPSLAGLPDIHVESFSVKCMTWKVHF
jgi:hypothetical protein